MHKTLTALVLCALCALCGAASAQPVDRTLFVTNQVSADVTVFRFDIEGNMTLVGRYPAGPSPQDCVLTPDGRRLLVLNASDGSGGGQQIVMLKVNADSTLTNLGVLGTAGESSLAFSIASTGFVLVPSVANRVMESLTLQNESLSPVSAVSTGDFPTRTISTPDGRLAYCISSVSPLDITACTLGADGTLSVTAAYDIPNAAGFGAEVHPSGDTLYVSTGQADRIHWYSIDQTTGALTPGGSVATGGSSVVAMALTPNGKWLYSCHVLSDTVRVSRVNADRSLTHLPFSYFIGADVRDVVTDGRFVFVTDESPFSGGVGVIVYRINQMDGSLTQLGPAISTGGVRPQYMSIWSAPPCIGDANGDGQVSFADITAVLSAMAAGTNGPIGDANLDGFVNFQDITTVLNALSAGGGCGQ